MYKWIFLLLFIPLGLAGQNLGLPTIPTSSIFVNDYADLLSDEEEQQLERMLKAYADSTTHQFAVVTIKRLEGVPIRTYAQALAESWGIGQAQFDNGLLLLISRQDREMAIEVGYGLEQEITDLEASRVITEVIRPSFKAGNYSQGVRNGMQQLMQMAQGLALNLPGQGPSLRFLFYLLFPLLFIGTWIAAIQKEHPPKSYGIATILSVFFIIFTEISYSKWIGGDYLIGLFLLAGTMLIFLIAFLLGIRAKRQRLIKTLPRFLEKRTLFEKLRDLYRPQAIDDRLEQFRREINTHGKHPKNADLKRWEAWRKDFKHLNFSGLTYKYKPQDWKEALAMVNKQNRSATKLKKKLFVETPSGTIFPLRGDYELRQTARKLRDKAEFDPSVYKKAAVDEMRQQLRSDIERFEPYGLKGAIPEELQKEYRERLFHYQAILDDSGMELPLDYEAILEKIQSKFTDFYWRSLISTFTKESVQKLRTTIDQKIQNTLSLGAQSPQGQANLRELYFTYYLDLTNHLGKRGRLVYSGSSSRSSGSSSSSSSFSSSSSSFGGGSFGGGGASGSW